MRGSRRDGRGRPASGVKFVAGRIGWMAVGSAEAPRPYREPVLAFY